MKLGSKWRDVNEMLILEKCFENAERKFTESFVFQLAIQKVKDQDI